MSLFERKKTWKCNQYGVIGELGIVSFRVIRSYPLPAGNHLKNGKNGPTFVSKNETRLVKFPEANNKFGSQIYTWIRKYDSHFENPTTYSMYFEWHFFRFTRVHGGNNVSPIILSITIPCIFIQSFRYLHFVSLLRMCGLRCANSLELAIILGLWNKAAFRWVLCEIFNVSIVSSVLSLPSHVVIDTDSNSLSYTFSCRCRLQRSKRRWPSM